MGLVREELSLTGQALFVGPDISRAICPTDHLWSCARRDREKIWTGENLVGCNALVGEWIL